MKIKSIIALAAIVGTAGVAQAKIAPEGAEQAPKIVAKEEGMTKAEKKKKMIEKFDEDGDGKLSAEEKAKMKEENGKMKKKKGKKVEKPEEVEKVGE